MTTEAKAPELLREALRSVTVRCHSHCTGLYLLDHQQQLVLFASQVAEASAAPLVAWPPSLDLEKLIGPPDTDAPLKLNVLVPGATFVYDRAAMAALPAYAPLAPLLRAGQVDGTGIVPIFWNGSITGLLVMIQPAGAPLTESALRNLLPLVSFIGFAARWRSEPARRARHETDSSQRALEARLVEAHRHICDETHLLLNSTRQRREFLQHALEEVMTAVGGSGGAVWLVDADRRRSRLYLDLGRGAAAVTEPRADDPTSNPSFVRPFPPEPIWQQTRLVALVGDGLSSELTRLQRAGIRHVLSVPLRSERDVVGWLIVRFTRNAPPECVSVSVEPIARTVSLALELDEVVRNARRDSLASERRRLAREMHDTVAQDAASLLIMLRSLSSLAHEDHPRQIAAELDQATDLVRKILKDTREGLSALRARHLERTGFVEALKRLAEEGGRSSPLLVSIDVGDTLPPFPPDIELEVLRIAREALTNARRHSNAWTFSILISVEGTFMRIRFADNGVGFNPAAITEGWGLIGMQERAERIGAQFVVHSSPGHGTEIVLQIPLVALEKTTELPPTRRRHQDKRQDSSDTVE